MCTSMFSKKHDSIRFLLFSVGVLNYSECAPYVQTPTIVISWALGIMDAVSMRPLVVFEQDTTQSSSLQRTNHTARTALEPESFVSVIIHFFTDGRRYWGGRKRERRRKGTVHQWFFLTKTRLIHGTISKTLMSSSHSPPPCMSQPRNILVSNCLIRGQCATNSDGCVRARH